MTHSFYMPTRVASGPGTLANIGAVARDLGLFDVLLVSDSGFPVGFLLSPIEALETQGDTDWRHYRAIRRG